MHYIELTKFNPAKSENLISPFERWLYALKFSDLYLEQPLPPSIEAEEGIQMAIDSMRKAYANEEVREMMLAQEKFERDQATLFAHARREGELTGEVKGKTIVAKRLLARGFSPDEVANMTDMPVAEVQQLSSDP